MHPHIQKLLVFGLIALFVLSWSSFLLPRRAPLPLNPEPEEEDIGESAIYNTTLGVRPDLEMILPYLNFC